MLYHDSRRIYCCCRPCACCSSLLPVFVGLVVFFFCAFDRVSERVFERVSGLLCPLCLLEDGIGVD